MRSLNIFLAKPMKQFISMITEKRVQATKEGKTALAAVYKLIGNSCYGRLGKSYILFRFGDEISYNIL